ncbi:MAG: cysteine desulfurase [bacterium]|nr:cysteine desulfurase [bacterium]
MVKSIYLDYASSAEPNPSSLHEQGVAAKKKLENARRTVAGILSARPEEIIFTGGGTEGNNLAIQGILYAAQREIFSSCALPSGGNLGDKKFPSAPHLITTNIEHPSVLETCRLLQRRGLAEISVIPVDENGIVDTKKIRKEIKKNTILISVMYANNEIGTIQPVKEIAKEIRHYRKHNKTVYPYFHTDAVQSVNYLDLNIEKLGVDLLTLSGSKIARARAVGVLYKKKSVPLESIWGGGDQEHGLRPGTENFPAILKFSGVLARAQKNKEKESQRLVKLRDYFLTSLGKKFQKVPLLINGDLENRLPNNVSITIPKIPSDLLVIELSAKGVMCSSKSACKSASGEGSYVIKALRPNADPEIGAVRFSLGADTTKRDIDYTVQTLSQILTKLKKWYT